jgi:hypothetical protein
MPHIFSAPGLAMSRIKVPLPDNTWEVDLAATTAVEGVMRTLVAAGWTVEQRSPAQGWWQLDTLDGAPYIPEGQDPKTYRVVLYQWFGGLDGANYSFYNPLADPPEPILPGVRVPVGHSSLETLANLCSSLAGWTGILDVETKRIYVMCSMPGSEANGAFQMWASGYYASCMQPEWGGYLMQSQIPEDSAAKFPIHVWVTSVRVGVSGRLGFVAPSLMDADWDYQGPPGSPFSPHVFEYPMAYTSGKYTVWANSYGFGLWEDGDPGLSGQLGGDSYSLNRVAFFAVPYLYPGSGIDSALFGLFGFSRAQIADSVAVSLFTISCVNGSAVTEGSEFNKWSFFAPRFLGGGPAAVTSVPLLNVMGRPLLTDALIAVARDNQNSPCRILGWLTDAFFMTDTVTLSRQVSYQGRNWLAFLTNPLPAASGFPRLIGTVFLAAPDELSL